MVFFRLQNIYVPSPKIRVVRVPRRYMYPEGARSAEVRKGVFYDDNDNIFVIHRRHRKFWSYLHWILPTIYCCILFWNYSVVTALFCFVFFSGGKDSCYNMMQCVKHGHVIVALANLKPSNGGRDIFINVIGCTIAFFWKMGRFSKDNTTSVMEKYVEKTECDFQCLICHCTILGSSWFRSAHSIVTVIT